VFGRRAGVSFDDILDRHENGRTNQLRTHVPDTLETDEAAIPRAHLVGITELRWG
jgi:hypothetical protein